MDVPHSFSQVKKPTHIWMRKWKNLGFRTFYKIPNISPGNLIYDFVTRKNILPFARWEELVEERISSSKFFTTGIARVSFTKIDKWKKSILNFPENPQKFHLSQPVSWNSQKKGVV
ncbi:hypothetical protein TNIN_493161 [Trichonephila inaurata madagascariensis]|uniref:Uncharacterized protein n=1 Tax=Trichonephila inaurata madagascariensis TaxID=2747483 RepID=A0A8X7CHV2_9ARAC|nr:hypothetical protein TNIN_493161 [Trichonephila inaurata madagascariensis]